MQNAILSIILYFYATKPFHNDAGPLTSFPFLLYVHRRSSLKIQDDTALHRNISLASSIATIYLH